MSRPRVRMSDVQLDPETEQKFAPRHIPTYREMFLAGVGLHLMLVQVVAEKFASQLGRIFGWENNRKDHA